MIKKFNELKSGEVFRSTNPDLADKEGICIATTSIKGKNMRVAIIYDGVVDKYIDNIHFIWDRDTEVTGTIDVSELQKIHGVHDRDFSERP